MPLFFEFFIFIMHSLISFITALALFFALYKKTSVSQLLSTVIDSEFLCWCRSRKIQQVGTEEVIDDTAPFTSRIFLQNINSALAFAG